MSQEEKQSESAILAEECGLSVTKTAPAESDESLTPSEDGQFVHTLSCPNCGSAVPYDAKECEYCGSTLAIADQGSHADGEDSAAEKKTRAKKRARSATLYLVKIAVLAAFATVLLLIEFPLLPAVPHLKFNISDVPALIASFMYGPVTGVVVSSVKVGLGLLIRGTSTAFVGDISNLISGAVYCLGAGVIYKLKRTKLGALLGCIVGSIFFVAAMWISNQFFLLPMFGIKDHAAIMTMLWWTLLFNVIKCAATVLVTFLLYKATHKLFDRLR